MTQSEPMKLRKPIVQGPLTYDTLTFRKPNGGDLCAAGYPFKFGRDEVGNTVRMFDSPSVTQLISRLSNVPLSVAKSLDVRDWNDAMVAVAGFFEDAEDQETNSTDTPSS
jgi:hypothetical protein